MKIKHKVLFLILGIFITLFGISFASDSDKKNETSLVKEIKSSQIRRKIVGTKIVLKADKIIIPAILNNTVAAEDFKKRLPFTVSGYRAEFDYCCRAESGKYDPKETQNGWKNGDISLAGGWFAVLFGGEEKSQSYSEMMIIAHIDKKDLELVKKLPKNVTFVVELAE